MNALFYCQTFQDIKFLMNGIEEHLTELTFVASEIPRKGPKSRYKDKADPRGLKTILQNSKKIKKLTLKILEKRIEPSLISNLLEEVFPKYSNLENLTVSTFIKFENLLRLGQSLGQNIELSNLPKLKFVLLDALAHPIYTDEQKQ